MKNIPLHNFSRDDASSVSFKHLPLERKGDYDSTVPHRHNYYEVFLFDKGGGEHDVDFNTFPIHNHSIHFVSPGQVHNLRRQPKSHGHVILFSRDFYSLNLQNTDVLYELPFLNNNSTHPFLNLTKKDFKIFNELAIKMKIEYQSDHSMKEELIRSFLNAFLVYSKRFFKNSGNESLWSQDNLASRFKLLLEKNFSTLHKVADYVDLLHISEKQLNTQIKTQLGMSPSDLIYDRIILEAKRLLLFSEHSIQEITYFLNFTDPSHFTKFFRGKTGFSPADFRKKGEKYPIK